MYTNKHTYIDMYMCMYIYIYIYTYIGNIPNFSYKMSARLLWATAHSLPRSARHLADSERAYNSEASW